MKNLLSIFTVFVGFCAMMGCGPSKAEIEAQRRADSARIADSVLAAERQRVADSIQTAKSVREADSIAQVKIMKEIESTFNKNDKANGTGIDAIVSKYASSRFKNTYAKYGKYSATDNTECHLLSSNIGYQILKGISVTNNTGNSCQLNFNTRYYDPAYDNPADCISDVGITTITLIREDGKWLIDDIKEDGHNTSFMKDPKSYRNEAA